jgi:hypothetical protein
MLRQAMETRVANITRKTGSGPLAGGSNNRTIDDPESDDVLPGGGGGDSLEGNAADDKLTDGGGDGQPTDAPITSGTTSQL